MNNYLKVLALTTVTFVAAEISPLANIAQSMAQANEFMIALYYLVGVGFILTGINRLKKLGHRTAFMSVDSGITGPMLLMFIGAFLLLLPEFINTINTTIWGQPEISAAEGLAYDVATTSFADTFKPLVQIIQFIGLIAMLRGFLILSRSTGQGAQPGTMSKGFVHIVGGILAVNIVGTINMVTTTFGAT